MTRHERMIAEMDPKDIFAKASPFENDDLDAFWVPQEDDTGDYLEDELFSFKRKCVDYAMY